jgi:hypothetical protein
MKLLNKKDYPVSIKIGPLGVDYKIEFVNDKKWFGKCSQKKQTIWLNSKLKKPQLFMTFIHEVLHAIEFELGLKVKHKTIYGFEDGLYNFLLDNASEFKLK